jgi:hypothetical protein
MKSITPSPQSEQQETKNKLPAGQERSGYMKPPAPEEDPVDEAAAESFPASDPPNFTGATVSPTIKERAEKERPDPHPSP